MISVDGSAPQYRAVDLDDLEGACAIAGMDWAIEQETELVRELACGSVDNLAFRPLGLYCPTSPSDLYPRGAAFFPLCFAWIVEDRGWVAGVLVVGPYLSEGSIRALTLGRLRRRGLPRLSPAGPRSRGEERWLLRRHFLACDEDEFGEVLRGSYRSVSDLEEFLAGTDEVRVPVPAR